MVFLLRDAVKLRRFVHARKQELVEAMAGTTVLR